MYIYGINGPVVKVKPSDELKMLELVKVGEDELIGEVIGIEKEYAVVQVYEGTTGLTIGEKVSGSGMRFSWPRVFCPISLTGSNARSIK